MSKPAGAERLGAGHCHGRSCSPHPRLVLRTGTSVSRHRCLAWPSPHRTPRRPIFQAVCWELPPAGSSLPSTCLRPVSVLCSLIDSLALLPALWWGGAPPARRPRMQGDPGAPGSLPGPPTVPSSAAAPWGALCVCSALQLRSQPGPVKRARNLPRCPLRQTRTAGFKHTDTTTSPAQAPVGSPSSWPHGHLHC